jgi:HlyD family secretion protein
MDLLDASPNANLPNPPVEPGQSGMDRKIEKKIWTKRRIVWGAGSVCALLFIVYVIASTTAASRLNVDVDRITISQVTRGPFQEYIPIQGTILPIQTFYLDATEGGRVEKRYAEAGSFVGEGDPIVKLVNSGLQLDVMYREALTYQQINDAQNRRLTIEQNTIAVKTSLADAEYQAQTAHLAYRRDSALVLKSLVPEQEYLQSRYGYESWVRRYALARENFRQDSVLRLSQLAQLEASVARLQENLEMTKKSLDNLVIRSPISGQLTSINAEIGASMSPGQRIGQIDVLESFKVRASIDEFYIARINPGLTGEFDLSGSTYALKITRVYPEVTSGRFAVDLEFAGQPPAGVRRGQTLQVRLELGEVNEAVLLPRGGFYQKTGGQWVFAVDRSGAYAVRKSIKLGRQNPLMYEVLEGLQPGDEVVTSSYDNFGDIDRLVLTK